MRHDVELIDLQAKWPHWQIWVVPTFDGTKSGNVWCARPLGELWPVLNEYSATDLDKAISDTSAS